MFNGTGLVAGASTFELQVTGRAGIPDSATAVTLNLTIAQSIGPGSLTVYPCGSPRPDSSSLNYSRDQTVARLIVAVIGTDGNVCVWTQAPTHLVIDVYGYHSAASTYAPLTTTRFLEQLNDDGVPRSFDGVSWCFGGCMPDGSWTLIVSGRGGVPSEATAVVLHVTVADVDGAGFTTVFPCDGARPVVSSLNYSSDQEVSNTVIVKIGASGKVCLFDSYPACTQLAGCLHAPGDYYVDVTGNFIG